MVAGPSAPRVGAGVAPSVHLGGLVLASRAPRRAAAWYRSALGLRGDGAVLTAGEAEIRFVSGADVAPAAVEAIRCIVNFHVDDVRAVEARLVDMEAVWVREVERTPWGMIGTVLDPDGNYVQIVEPDRGPLPWGAKGREQHT
jgi:predicted enzyme related to lactoylglutathione lyase